MSLTTEPPGVLPSTPLLLRALDRIDAFLMFVCKIIIVATGTFLLVLLTAGVISRYFFNFSLIWMGEMPEQLFPWMIAAGVALAAVMNSHIAVDLLVKVLPTPVRKALIVIVQLLVAATYLLLTKLGLDVAAITAFERSPVLKIPGSYGYYAFVLGTSVVAFAALSQLTRFLMTGQEPVSGGFGQEHTQ